MAVEIKYVVIREGEEKMSFASKKEADAYDKMLDLAEVLNDWLVASPLEMDDVQRDTMAMWLAEKKRCSISCELADCRSKRRPHRTPPRRRLPPRLLRRVMTPCRRPKRAKPRQPERWRSVTGRSAPMLPSHVPLRIFSHI